MPRGAPIRQAGFFCYIFPGGKKMLYIYVYIYPNFNIDGRKGVTCSSQNMCVYIFINIYRQFPMIFILSCE